MSNATDVTAWLDGPDTTEGDAPNNPLLQHFGGGPPVQSAPPTPIPSPPAVPATKQRRKRTPKPTPPDPAEMTDEWHARRFVDLYADRLRYCQTLGGWIVYDGKRWRKGDSVTPEGF